MYSLEELAKEAGYKSLTYVRKLCRLNLVEGIDYEVNKIKTRVVTTLKQTQSSLTWFSSLTKVKKKLTHDISTSQQTNKDSCVNYSRDDLTVISREDDDSVSSSDFNRVNRFIRDFCRAVINELKPLIAETRELRDETRRITDETRELRVETRRITDETRDFRIKARAFRNSLCVV